jgi:hypothetical protein
VSELAQAAALVLAAVFAWAGGAKLTVARGSTVGCACFGGGAEDRPVSVLELVRNAGLGALAIVASGAGTGSALWPSLPAAVLVTVLVALARVGLAAAELRQAGGHVLSTPLPGEVRR